MKDAQGHGSNPRGKMAAHQARVMSLVSDFAKSESGEGIVPHSLHDFDIREKGPGEIGSTLKHAAASVSEGHIDLHSLVHFAHFLGFLGAIALLDVIALSMGLR
jgi:hypothetical protein